VKIALDIQAKTGKKLTDFQAALGNNAALKALGERVKAFAGKFPMPGGGL